MEQLVKSNGLVRPCCMPENLEPYRLRPDLVVRRCRICGARHFEMTVDPGNAFARGEGL